MISVAEAFDIVMGHSHDFGIEEVEISLANNRILREDIIADRDIPPYDRVSMDGIAIHFDTFANGLREFPVESMSPAGAPVNSLHRTDHCIEIMTGSILPLGTDTIIPYEWMEIRGNIAFVLKDDVKQGQNVHPKGFDKKAGDILIRAGKKITPKEIAIIASTGKSRIKVSKHPAVLILSTGDELIDLQIQPEPHQVRMTNKYMLGASLHDLGIHAESRHFPDDRDILFNNIKESVNRFDLIIITGGVSAGKYDHIPEILEASGITKHFHKVNQRPGKPFWFGSQENGCTVFALPGNPVSAFMCFVKYIRPWILKSLLSAPAKKNYAILASQVTIANKLTTFINVVLHHDENAQLMATPTQGHGSGDFTALEMADAFLELPPGPKVFKNGEVFPVYPF